MDHFAKIVPVRFQQLCHFKVQILCDTEQDVMATIVKKENLSLVFPNIFNLAAIAQLIPASTADGERAFLN